MMRLLLALFLLLPVPVHAAWTRATSDRFIVYTEGKPEQAVELTQKLEKFDAVLARVTGLTSEASPNKLKVYVVGNVAAVQRALNARSSNVAGFYHPSLYATIAVVPRQAENGTYDLDAQTVLFHEYAHHFMLQNAPVAYPAWYVEGFAEYMSTVEFKSNGDIWVGTPARHRFYGLATLPEYPVARLLDPNDVRRGDDQTEGFYGWSWLLTHFLSFNKERADQTKKYFALYADGKPPLEAATAAFGPLDVLQKDLLKYRDARRMSYVAMRGQTFASAKVEAVALSQGEGAAMALTIRGARGSRNKVEVDLFVAEARKLGRLYPAEPAVLDLLAEGELDAEKFRRVTDC